MREMRGVRNLLKSPMSLRLLVALQDYQAIMVLNLGISDIEVTVEICKRFISPYHWRIFISKMKKEGFEYQIERGEWNGSFENNDSVQAVVTRLLEQQREALLQEENKVKKILTSIKEEICVAEGLLKERRRERKTHLTLLIFVDGKVGEKIDN